MRESESRFNYKRSGSMNRNWRQRSAAIHISFILLCDFIFICIVNLVFWSLTMAILPIHCSELLCHFNSYCSFCSAAAAVVVISVAEKSFVLIKTAGIIGVAYCFVV